MEQIRCDLLFRWFAAMGILVPFLTKSEAGEREAEMRETRKGTKAVRRYEDAHRCGCRTGAYAGGDRDAREYEQSGAGGGVVPRVRCV